jgi:hypothetical protein
MGWASGEKEQAISRFSIDQDDRLRFNGIPAPIGLPGCGGKFYQTFIHLSFFWLSGDQNTVCEQCLNIYSLLEKGDLTMDSI